MTRRAAIAREPGRGRALHAFAITPLAVVAASVLGLATPLPARAVPPVPAVCDQADVGERLKCKHDNAIAQQDHMVGVIEGSPLSDLLTDAQMTGLSNARNRAVRAAGRANPSDFKTLSRKRNVTCQIQEFSGDGDGVCESKMNEQCLEVIGDGIGDDVQPCRLTGPPGQREVCAEICDEQAINENEDNFDEEFAADMEQIYDDVTNQTMEANEVLETEALSMPSLRALAVSGNSCSFASGGLTRVPFVAFVVVKTLAVTTRGVADIAERGCDQTAFGFNGGAVCIATETIASLAAIAWNAVDEIEGTLDSLTIDAMLACARDTRTEIGMVMNQLGALQGGIGGVQGEIGDVKGEVAALQTNLANGFLGLQNDLSQTRSELKLLLEETIRLLKTPQGQRSGFNQLPGS